MQVQIIDSRPPLSAVIALAKQAHEPLLSKWQEDMATMAAEVARKYFGTLTEEAVRDGVGACVTLLSIGLLRSTSGAIEPEVWLQTMRKEGVRGVSKLAVELIKACDALPDHEVIFAPPQTLRPSLLLSLLSHASKAGISRAYTYLMRETAQRSETKRMIGLAEWLLANTPSGRVARRDMDTAFGFGNETPDAEIVIHHVLSLVCGVAKHDPYSDSLEDDPPEMGPPDFQVTSLGPLLLAAARKRYDELLAKIPSELKPALFFKNVSWFDRFIVPTRKGKGKGAGGGGG